MEITLNESISLQEVKVFKLEGRVRVTNMFTLLSPNSKVAVVTGTGLIMVVCIHVNRMVSCVKIQVKNSVYVKALTRLYNSHRKYCNGCANYNICCNNFPTYLHKKGGGVE